LPEKICVKPLLLLLSIAACVCAEGSLAADSVHAQVWAGAEVSDQAPSGLKSSVSGMIDAWADHSFTNAIFCRLYLRGTPSFPTPFVEEAFVGYRLSNLTAEAGFLSTHVGRAELYKPFSVFNQFTRTSAVWDSYGFGFGVRAGFGGMALAGAATINTNENGSADVLWTALHNAVACDRVLVGIQTANLRNQDNSLTLGDDFTLTFPLLGVHMSAGYSAYQGYGNPTIKPGDQFEIFGEAKYVPFPRLFLSGMGYYESYRKGYLFVNAPGNTLEYSLQTLLCGLDAQYMAVSWLGVYAGCEYQQSMSTGSQIPEAGVAIVPVANRTLIRVGWESTIVGSSQLNRVAAIVWFVY
jgi:hypothetical protein